jgi:hypothetical protein
MMTINIQSSSSQEWPIYKRHVDKLFADCKLEGKISKLLFHKSLTGFYNLNYKGKIEGNKLIIIDFRQMASNKRLYIIDVEKRNLLWMGLVAHGVKSGKSYAIEFSNKRDSWKSSLGFFVVGKKYSGKNGLSIKLDGLDKSYNSNARNRNIVIHPAYYVDSIRVGHSKGCIAIPIDDIEKVIGVIQEGDCLFIYSNQYKGKSAKLMLDEELARKYYCAEHAKSQLNELYDLIKR